MRQRSRATLDDLRQAIECLPRHTRVAMLEGIASNAIIAGAYATGDGVCPMLAAHRAGGRTNAIAFAKAWDRVAFRGARRTRDPDRPAERPGDPDRSAELRGRPGWVWTRVVRRYDDYERVLARLEQAHANSGSEPAVVS